MFSPPFAVLAELCTGRLSRGLPSTREGCARNRGIPVFSIFKPIHVWDQKGIYLIAKYPSAVVLVMGLLTIREGCICIENIV